MKNNKKEYFEAFLVELFKWYNVEFPRNNTNDLSKLKVLKLLFLGVSKNDLGALDVFNNFKAWDLGPVEKDIYDIIKSNTLNIGSIDNTHLELNNSEYKFSTEAKNFAISIVNFLKRKNTNLIKLSASTLVDITHKWDCWVVVKMFGGEDISKKLILSSKKFYN